jgi:hypothetical protein
VVQAQAVQAQAEMAIPSQGLAAAAQAAELVYWGKAQMVL